MRRSMKQALAFSAICGMEYELLEYELQRDAAQHEAGVSF